MPARRKASAPSAETARKPRTAAEIEARRHEIAQKMLAILIQRNCCEGPCPIMWCRHNGRCQWLIRAKRWYPEVAWPMAKPQRLRRSPRHSLP